MPMVRWWFFVMVSVAVLSAFPIEFHQFVARTVLLERYPNCSVRIDEGVAYAISVLNDTHRWHCWDALTMCPALDGRYCPTVRECPAWREGAAWFESSKGKRGCEQAFDLAVASFYYAESQDQLQNIVNVPSQCISEAETAVRDAVPLMEKNLSSVSVSFCCSILNPEKCRFDAKEIRRVIGVVSGAIIKPFRQYPYDPSNEGNTGCFYGTVSCGENETCLFNTCVPGRGCKYKNPDCPAGFFCDVTENKCIQALGCAERKPPCPPDSDCINNRCVRKPGCAYDNPPCNESQECVDNQCVNRVGCRYNNPPCAVNEDCVDNACIQKKGCAFQNPPCASGYRCMNNTCVSESACEKDTDCSFGWSCKEGMCVPPTPSQGLCFLPLFFVGGVLISSLVRRQRS